MSRISVPISKSERAKLRRMADEQKRSEGAQAAILISSALAQPNCSDEKARADEKLRAEAKQ